MPFKKLADEATPKKCRHPEHDPPGHIVLAPGTYMYTCPGCGQETTVRIPRKPWLLLPRAYWKAIKT